MQTTIPRLVAPREPADIRSSLRTVLAQTPTEGERRLDAGDWIACPLWDAWGEKLMAAGWREDRFHEVISGYRNELRLWVIGERPWTHVITGLIGRIERRAVA